MASSSCNNSSPTRGFPITDTLNESGSSKETSCKPDACSLSPITTNPTADCSKKKLLSVLPVIFMFSCLTSFTPRSTPCKSEDQALSPEKLCKIMDMGVAPAETHSIQATLKL